VRPNLAIGRNNNQLSKKKKNRKQQGPKGISHLEKEQLLREREKSVLQNRRRHNKASVGKRGEAFHIKEKRYETKTWQRKILVRQKYEEKETKEKFHPCSSEGKRRSIHIWKEFVSRE